MRLRLDQDWLVHDELADVLCGHELGVPIVDHLVDDLIYQHKVLANALLIEDSTVVTEDLHHAVDDV